MLNLFMEQTIILDVLYFRTTLRHNAITIYFNRQASLKGRIQKVVQGQVYLFWASDNCDIAENEEADELAKKGVSNGGRSCQRRKNCRKNVSSAYVPGYNIFDWPDLVLATLQS